MAVQTTTNLSNSIRTLYSAKYKDAAMALRLYDQLAQPVGKDGVETAARMGYTVSVPFLSDLPIATARISQLYDITPRQLRDATATITAVDRADAIQWAEPVDIAAYTDYGAQRHEAIGKQQMLSVEFLAMTAAYNGSNVHRATARASLDAGTAAHRLSDGEVSEIATQLAQIECPTFDWGMGAQWMAVMHPAAFHDLRAGGNVVNVGVYQDKAIILKFELGQIGPFKLVVSGHAKALGGAGSDNASNVDTTIAASSGSNGSNVALATTIEVASASNISSGDWLVIGAEETSTTYDETMEFVKYVSTASTTITIVGGGANGGLKYDHAVGVSVRNADSVYPVVYGFPGSLAKLYDAQTGEFGKIVGPKVDGIVDQFATLGWKFYGGYGRWRENILVRGEYCSSLEA